MQIGEIWPFLLPGVLLQLLMQILCIAESVREDNRKPFHRVLYILSIAIFGLAAIAFHLLRVKRHRPKIPLPPKWKGLAVSQIRAFSAAACLSSDGTHMLAENVGTRCTSFGLAAINLFSHNAAV